MHTIRRCDLDRYHKLGLLCDDRITECDCYGGFRNDVDGFYCIYRTNFVKRNIWSKKLKELQQQKMRKGLAN